MKSAVSFIKEWRIFMNIFFLLKPKAVVSYIYDDNSIRQGLEKLRAHKFTAIPVIKKDGTYVGTVSEGDFLWHIVDRNKYDGIKSEEDNMVSDLIKNDRNPPVKSNATMDELLLRVMRQNFVPVTDDRNIFIGIVTRTDVIKYYYDKEQNDKYKDITNV